MKIRFLAQIPRLGILTVLLLVIVNPVHGEPLTGAQGSRIQSYFMSQDPAPAEAGKDVDLRWQVVNTIPGTIKNLRFHLDADYPFLFDAGDSPDKEMGPSAGTNDDQIFYVLHYKLRVANNAVKGKYKVTLSWNGGDGWTKKDFELFVEGLSRLTLSKTSENIIAPGQIKEMSMTLWNSGTAVAEDTMVEVEPIMDSTGTPLYSLIGSGTRIYVGDIGPGNLANITLNILINERAKEGAYNLPINIYSKNANISREYIGISITSKVAIIDVKTDPREIIPGKISTLKVKVKNFGNNDVNSVRIRILENELLREKTGTYLGTIKPDDDKTAEFELNVIPNSSNDVPIELMISYRDGNGEHSAIEKANIVVASAEVRVNQPLIQQMGVVLVLLILLGVVVIRSYRIK